MGNKHNQHFTIMLRTFPLMLSLANSSSVTLISANHGTPSVVLQNLLLILSISFHPLSKPQISMPYIILVAAVVM
jgi:hypothetical protein